MVRRHNVSWVLAATAIAGSVLLGLMAPVSAELLLFYDFNTATDPDVVVDLSGNNNDADVIGAEYTDPGRGRTGGADDRAMDFLSHADAVYIDIPSAFDGALDTITDNDSVTIGLWLYGADESPVDGTVFWFAGSDQRQLLAHVPWGDQIIYFDSAGCDSCLLTDEPDETKWMGQWNHYAFVKDENAGAIYQNGELLVDTLGLDIMDQITTARFGTFANGNYPYAGLMDEIGVWDEALSQEQIQEIMTNGIGGGDTRLQAGDADQDLDVDQLDLVKVQIAAKYLTGQPATWGEGDWDGAPGGTVGNPPPGDGQFNQIDIIAALNAGKYLTGPYGTLAGPAPLGGENDEQTSIVYDPVTGELRVNAPAGTELTSINIDSASGIFTGEPAQNLGGSFDNDANDNIFKATFGSSFGSLGFGNVARAGLSQDFVVNDLTVVGSLAGGGDLGNVDLIYVPEPLTMTLLGMGLLGVLLLRRRQRP